MSYQCDNVSQCHDMLVIDDGDSAMRVFCKLCTHQYVIRKDPIKGVPENRQYSKLFKRDVLQGNSNLFYKYHPEFLRK